MRRDYQQGWSLALFLIASLALLALPHRGSAADKEPVYQGVPFSRVIELRAPETIASAALEIGIDRSLPILIRALTVQDTIFGQAKQEIWKHLPPATRSTHLSSTPMPAASTRFKALASLGLIGVEARPAVAAVVGLYSAETNMGFRQIQLGVLSDIGIESPKAIAVLEKAARDPNSGIRASAIMGLASIGPGAAQAVPALIEEIRQAREQPPWWAYQALSRIGPAASNALPVLLASLCSESNAPFALQGLRGLGPAATPAIPELSKMIATRQPGYPMAAEVLLNIGPPARESLPLLESMLSDTNPVARVMSAAALAKVGGLYEKALPVLIKELGNTNRSRVSWSPPFCYPRGDSVRFSPQIAAAWLLAEVGPPAKAAVPALRQAMESRDSWFSVVAARALWRIQGKADGIVPMLTAALRITKSSQTDASIAAMTLAEMGSAAHAALPQLENARLHGNPNLRRQAVLALARLRETSNANPTPKPTK